jgi:hypothetical protein
VRGFLAAGLLLMGGGALADSPGEPAFTFALPVEVGDVSGWEEVSGEFALPNATGRYCFYVNPRFLALYQVMRYRVSFAADGPAAPVPSEKVVWNRRPGERVPLVVWERIFEGEPTGWRVMTAGSPEYQTEMGRLMSVLAAHRTARVQEAAGP